MVLFSLILTSTNFKIQHNHSPTPCTLLELNKIYLLVPIALIPEKALREMEVPKRIRGNSPAGFVFRAKFFESAIGAPGCKVFDLVTVIPDSFTVWTERTRSSPMRKSLKHSSRWVRWTYRRRIPYWFRWHCATGARRYLRHVSA